MDLKFTILQKYIMGSLYPYTSTTTSRSNYPQIQDLQTKTLFANFKKECVYENQGCPDSNSN